MVLVDLPGIIGVSFSIIYVHTFDWLSLKARLSFTCSKPFVLLKYISKLSF